MLNHTNERGILEENTTTIQIEDFTNSPSNKNTRIFNSHKKDFTTSSELHKESTEVDSQYPMEHFYESDISVNKLLGKFSPLLNSADMKTFVANTPTSSIQFHPETTFTISTAKSLPSTSNQRLHNDTLEDELMTDNLTW
ncbi:hypothetical protein Salat_2109400 [Sesamum alatum]|uniref:Uncharacterized protein n=1 Tax=Sesamum alatum TaxID=300844 RepID=A0AAE1Y1Z1_9LAMI|nr:hypothetical protein Salat_2109400 [Sesamum alatum]